MAATNNMHNLTTLIKRLEAATSRLEDIALSTFETPKPNGPVTSSVLPAPPPPPAAAAPPPKPAAEPLPESIEEFDSFLESAVKKYADISKALGGPIAEQAASVFEAFKAQRKVLLITTKAKKPSMSDPIFMELLQPLQDGIQKVNEIRDNSRGQPQFNQLSAVSESISVLAWVTLENKPHKHVEESLGSAQYWGNRVLKEYKEKDPKQVEWVQSYYQIFKDLVEYIKDVFPSGVPWNPKGIDAREALKQVSAATSTPTAAPAPPPPPPAGGLPPPPPPPPPLNFDSPSGAATQVSTGGIEAVFSELNKGEAITKSLKKVDASQMTHKNPSLRAGSSVPQRSDSQDSGMRGKSPAPSKKPKPESMRTKKPPRMQLDGNKWIVENYDNEPAPVTIEVEISHSILISRCSKTTIIVKGKANAISVDNSSRLSLVIDSLVSSVDVIKSPNFAMQVLGTLPTVLMDQVDNAQIYLGKDSLTTEVFTSKCSGVNLNLLSKADDDADEDDYKEVAIPEQIRTYIGKDGKVASEIVEHAG